ncbi:helix-turn-helix transcriptional regulator [Xenorhabdus sp. PB30.3]|uniref:helix-turn-helix domain-containing protein n=1 Tax=Xenorhabdus sp. PB30.3 TaxID=2788941 RepID=UPI001E49231F|nr:helix-turn-helix transcriptional regulator [Xenorhabdus sp. PB30.3]MCC8380803.1 helix-turn-helix transcriptional regulator [Xenorhabdus sp. PB30.3]
MILPIAERLKLIRESERLSRSQASKEWKLKEDALWRYENSKTIPNADVMTNILSHPRFEKYSLWFITGKTMPEVGLIAPALYDAKNYENKQEESA